MRTWTMLAVSVAFVTLSTTGCSSGTTSAIETSRPVSPVLAEPAAMHVDQKVVRIEADGKPLSSGANLLPGSTVQVFGIPPGTVAILVGEVNGVVTTGGGLFSIEGQRNSWTTRELPPNGKWKLTVEGLRVEDRIVEFATKEPSTIDTPYIYPSSGTYGVGMPITVTFDAPVENKAEVQSRLSVTTSQPVGAAAWSWTSPSTVVFLPDKFWPAYTDVAVEADLEGVQVSKGVWGKSARGEFSIGRALIMENDLSRHTLDVYRDGELIRRLPMSGGKAGWETQSGIKVISELFEVKRLQNSSGPETWDVVVPWAMRLTYTGEFIHSAPWNGDIGSANTSHGCTNLTTQDAQWLFGRVLIGDVVDAYGSGVAVPSWNGLGGVWNQSWASWKDGGAELEFKGTTQQPVSPMDFPG